MNIWTLIGLFCGGFAFGWATRYFSVVDRLAREVTKFDADVPKFEKFAADIEETGFLAEATEAGIDLAILICFDTGQVSDAKKFIVYRLGIFYHKWNLKPKTEVPDRIQKELVGIREAAMRFESVRPVLTFNPSDGPPTFSEPPAL